MKKLKTGDVKRFPRDAYMDDSKKWATVGRDFNVWRSRRSARHWKLEDERIARIISIGPKYVTVRISK